MRHTSYNQISACGARVSQREHRKPHAFNGLGRFGGRARCAFKGRSCSVVAMGFWSRSHAAGSTPAPAALGRCIPDDGSPSGSPIRPAGTICDRIDPPRYSRGHSRRPRRTPGQLTRTCPEGIMLRGGSAATRGWSALHGVGIRSSLPERPSSVKHLQVIAGQGRTCGFPMYLFQRSTN